MGDLIQKQRAQSHQGALTVAGAESVASHGEYRVKLEAFEGPLDLLLYLIRKEEVSIYDIPIARITEQYLDYLRAMEELDIAVASEFLVMAATLIHIKSQMLLPRDPILNQEPVEDPRSELVQQLLEHQKFKAAANLLHQRAIIESGSFGRGEIESDRQNPEIRATVFQLFELFREAMARQQAMAEIEIVRDQVTLAEKIAEIKMIIAQKGEASARMLFERARSRNEMVTIFLAILELVKELIIRLVQEEAFGDILLIKR
jgi:segregation and condensation protein A